MKVAPIKPLRALHELHLSMIVEVAIVINEYEMNDGRKRR